MDLTATSLSLVLHMKGSATVLRKLKSVSGRAHMCDEGAENRPKNG